MITKDNLFIVMEWFFKYPSRSFHIRELARLTGLSSAGIIKIIKRLKRERLLLSKKERVTEDIYPDFDGNFTLRKRLYNIYSLYDCGLINEIKSFYEMPRAIALFGSYSNGTDAERSDIDLAVFSSNDKIPDLSRFEKKLARKINIHVIGSKKIDEGFKNALYNGIVLEGVIEIK